MWKKLKEWLFGGETLTLREEIEDVIFLKNRALVKDHMIWTGDHGPKTGTVLSGQLLDEMARG